ncbi:hypothetical protein EVAR_37773_1 [Eumeta japonica]|uniref:Uncharacterized protein n=1 Tax=Eumeta variegata TaxID=151549 RepID=A0A4C1WQJ7_EUMVA|nr:hypothetical protein EVAR_37773_1 [Eumeta japonica]
MVKKSIYDVVGSIQNHLVAHEIAIFWLFSYPEKYTKRIKSRTRARRVPAAVRVAMRRTHTLRANKHLDFGTRNIVRKLGDSSFENCHSSDTRLIRNVLSRATKRIASNLQLYRCVSSNSTLFLVTIVKRFRAEGARGGGARAAVP